MLLTNRLFRNVGLAVDAVGLSQFTYKLRDGSSLVPVGGLLVLVGSELGEDVFVGARVFLWS